MKWNWNWLNDMPTNQAMALVTIVLWIPTCVCSLLGCKINDGWYGTLISLTFAVVLHASVKRLTYKRPDGSSTEVGTDG